MKNKIILLISAILISIIGKAQEVNAEPEMADTFRSEGKIYVVISVLVIAFSCIIGYLVYLDMKLKRLENKK